MLTASPAPPTGTRSDLIEAGIRLFGQQGFAATSVRQLATEAKANVAAIAYHFGSKEGLRLACAEDFGRRMAAALGPEPTRADTTAAAARDELHQIVRAVLGFLLGGKGSNEIVPFMLRELADDGPGLDVAYQSFAEPTHRRLCTLWATATGGEPESETTRLAVFALIGQLMYFRIGQSIVTRRMGWNEIGPTEVAAISRRITRNLDAMLDMETGG